MKILHVSAYDYGGAGTAAFRFHKNLADRGIDSRMLVLAKRSDDPNVIQLPREEMLSLAWRFVVKAWMKIRTNQDYYFQDQMSSVFGSAAACLNEIPYQPDLIVVHWITGFCSLADLYQLYARRKTPVIWYLMDMAPLTGGCHYAWDCTGYMGRCGKCPALYSNNSVDMSARTWKTKYSFIRKMSITVVAGGWLLSRAKQASLFNGIRKEKIMLGVNAKVFTPHSRGESRKMLDMPVDRKILFIGAQSAVVRRKGFRYFVEAAGILANNPAVNNDEITIVSAGDGTVKKYLKSSGFEHIHLGVLDQNGLVKAYQAADVFVCPSIQDAGPMMIKESLMCGTPVVAFNMGVAGDLVHTNVTGYRADLMDSEDLARGMLQLISLSPAEAEKMSLNCRDIGVRLASEDVQVDRFINLAHSILEGNSAGPTS